jgi:hypothetical protein
MQRENKDNNGDEALLFSEFLDFQEAFNNQDKGPTYLGSNQP